MAAAGDLATRIRRRMRSRLLRLKRHLGSLDLEPGASGLATRFHHPVDASRKATLLAMYQSLFEAAAECELAEAQRLLRHEFCFLSHPSKHGPYVSWSQDPATGRDWSGGYSADIPYRGIARLGDVKLSWELNKHQYFFTLGKAAWLTGDAKYARKITEHIDHWIANNPCYSGIHWISALETGTRAISWVLAFPFFSDYCDAEFLGRMTRSMAQHLLFVEQNLSTGEYANTHLVGEAAILVIGALFLESKHSKRWLALGLHHLNEQIHRQVRSDGVHAEQSIAYHRFFLDQYLLTHAILQANGLSLPSGTLHRMEQMVQFLMDVMHPDGSVPSFGDGDDARGVWLHASASKDYRSILALGAVLFRRSDFKMAAGTASEELLWLYGDSGLQAFAELPSKAPDHTSIAYPSAGYYVMRGGWAPTDAVLIFDCGPLGLGPAGHGHADALSLQLFANGYPFLTDPGTYSYNLDYAWRDIFRSSHAHNTVVVDDQDQSLPRDRMSWETSARARCHRWITTTWFDLVEGEHDGYCVLPSPVRHRRVVVSFKPDVWIILDHLSGPGQHKIEINMHLRPDCAVTAQIGRMLLTSAGGSRLWASILTQHPEGPASSKAFTHDAGSWFSDTYGAKLQSSRLHMSAVLHGTGMVVSGYTTAPDVELTAAFVDGGVQIGVQRHDQPRETLFYQVDLPCPPDPHAVLNFDGDLLYLRTPTIEGGALWATGFHRLTVDGCLNIRSQNRIKSMSLHDGVCEMELDADQSADPDINALIPLQINIRRS
jgi:uncharacterized heparinase superfamily protein